MNLDEKSVLPCSRTPWTWLNISPEPCCWWRDTPAPWLQVFVPCLQVSVSWLKVSLPWLQVFVPCLQVSVSWLKVSLPWLLVSVPCLLVSLMSCLCVSLLCSITHWLTSVDPFSICLSNLIPFDCSCSTWAAGCSDSLCSWIHSLVPSSSCSGFSLRGDGSSSSSSDNITSRLWSFFIQHLELDSNGWATVTLELSLLLMSKPFNPESLPTDS